MTTHIKNNQSGQALIMLLFFVMIGIIITTVSVAIISTNSLSATDTEMGEITREIAETGAERAILQLLRNDGAYTGEDLDNTIVPEWDSGWKAHVTVIGTTNLIIDSVATAGKYTKKVEVTAQYVDNELQLGTWKEIN